MIHITPQREQDFFKELNQRFMPNGALLPFSHMLYRAAVQCATHRRLDL